MRVNTCKLWGPILVLFTIMSCTRDKETGHPEGECSYKITIEEQTTHPNQFGQDHLILASSTGLDGKSMTVLNLIQTKADAQPYNIFHIASGPLGQFNTTTPVGTTFAVEYYNSGAPHLPDFGNYVYMLESTPEDGVLTLTVMENSADRIRFKLSGTVMKTEGGVENTINLKQVPVEAEFSFGRSYYSQTSSGGIDFSSANCECK